MCRTDTVDATTSLTCAGTSACRRARPITGRAARDHLESTVAKRAMRVVEFHAAHKDAARSPAPLALERHCNGIGGDLPLGRRWQHLDPHGGRKHEQSHGRARHRASAPANAVDPGCQQPTIGAFHHVTPRYHSETQNAAPTIAVRIIIFSSEVNLASFDINTPTRTHQKMDLVALRSRRSANPVLSRGACANPA